jgi:hypothetical protein
MRRVQNNALIVGLFFVLKAIAQNKQTLRGMNKIEPLPRDLEVQLPLSALPPQLRDNATVSVLNPDKGFEVARKGTNGFHPLVARTGDDTFRGTWPRKQYRDDILYPISFDEAGAKAQMRVFFDAAEVQAQGITWTRARAAAVISESMGIPSHLSLPGRSITASVFVRDHHALGHIENATKRQHPRKEKKAMTTRVMHSGADELEVQRRDICAHHASQAQQ